MKRQVRGEARMRSLLTAAEAVFAEVGYEQATTNLIAERAGASPGTLYQFFANKQAIAEAIAEHYAAKLALLHEKSSQPDHIQLPLRAVIDRLVDPIIAFDAKSPAFKNLLLGATLSDDLQARVQVLHEASVEHLGRFVAQRSPEIPRKEVAAMVKTCILIYQGFLPVLRSKDRKERTRAVRELKTVLERYLGPVIGG